MTDRAYTAYVTTYCNHAHRVSDGKPIAHECRIILTANGNHTLRNGATMPRPACGDPFPPYERVIPKHSRTSRSIGVSAKYLASVFAALGADVCVKITIDGELDPILFEAKTGLGTTTIVIMPMRL